MRPINYIKEAEDSVTRAANNTFLSEPIEVGSPRFRDMVFMAAVFAIQQDIKSGRVFPSDPVVQEVIEEYTFYTEESARLRNSNVQEEVEHTGD